MAIFELRAPDGSLQSIEAEDEQAARAKLAEMQASQPGLPAPLSAGSAFDAAALRTRRSVRHGAGRSGVEMIEAVSPTAADAVRSAGTGLAQGAIGVVGLPGDVRGMASMATDFVGNKLGATPESVDAFKAAVRRVTPGVPGLRAFAYAPSSAEIKKDVEGYTGEFHQPKTMTGGYARTFGEMVPAALGGPAGLARRLLMGVAAPAIGSETAGQFTKGTEWEPWMRMAGALTGGALGMRGWTPAPATPEHAARTAIVEGAGTRLTAGQRSGNEVVQALEGIGARVPFDKSAHRLNERSRQDAANSMERLQRESGDIRDLEAMRNASAKAEASGAEGPLTPKQVKAAIVAQHRGPSAPGQDKLADFVDAADAVMKPIPEKWGPNETAVAAALGFPAGWLAEPMVGPRIATILGASVPAIAGRAAVSGPGQWYLGNQAMPVSRQDLIRALLAQGVVARPKEPGE